MARGFHLNVGKNVRGSLENPAIGVDAIHGESDIETLEKIANHAREYDSHVLVAVDANNTRLMSRLRKRDVTVVETAERAQSNPEEVLCSAGREVGFPGILLHPGSDSNLQYQENQERLQKSNQYALPAHVSGKPKKTEVVAAVLATSDDHRSDSLIAKSQNHADDVLVVGNKRGDATGTRTRNGNENVIELGVDEDNRGPMQALVEHVAYEYADDPVLVVLTPDRSPDPSKIPLLVEEIRDGDAEVVLGHRTLGDNSEETPDYTRIWSRVRDGFAMGEGRQRESEFESELLALSENAVSLLESRDIANVSMSGVITESIRANLNVRVKEYQPSSEQKEVYNHQSGGSEGTEKKKQQSLSDEESAIIGSNTEVHERATVGHEYDDETEPTVIGDDGTVRAGTIIYEDVVIGDGFSTGHDALVREQTTIGQDVLVGTKTVIDGYTDVGSDVSLQTGVYVPSYTEIGDEVFVGPRAVLTNDPYPIRQSVDLAGPTLCDGCSVGANATILPDVTVGQNAFVAAGSVVTEDVPADTLAIGVPAAHRQLPGELSGGNEIA